MITTLLIIYFGDRRVLRSDVRLPAWVVFLTIDVLIAVMVINLLSL